MKERYKILARHKWVKDCTITESVNLWREDAEVSYRRFTATIKGWRNFRIYDGQMTDTVVRAVIKRVERIKERIENGDDNVFKEDVSLFSIS